MLYQRAPLPAEHEYFLDAACEMDELNGFDHSVLLLLGDRGIVADLIAAGGSIPHPLRSRHETCYRLDAYAHQIVSGLAPHEQAAFAADGLMREPLRLRNIADYLAHFNFEDETRGGANKPFRRHLRCDENSDPTPRVRRRLYAPAAIRRYASLEDQSIPMARRLTTGLRRLPPALPGAAELIHDLLREQRASHRGEWQARRAAFEAEQRRRYLGDVAPAKIDRRDRRAVRRAAQFVEALLGPGQVSAFAQGRAVMLAGHSFALEVIRRRSLTSMGHGAIDVGLCDHDGTKLSQVCVYFDKTPALDQLAALALHIHAGAEDEIINTGNLFQITAAGSQHPIVVERQSKLRPHQRDAAEAIERLMRHGIGPTEHEKRMAAVRRYTADTRSLYVQAVTSQVWGRDAHRLRPYCERIAQPETNDERCAA